MGGLRTISKKENKISMFAWKQFLTTTKISTLALFEGFFQCNIRSGHLCKVYFYILFLILFQTSMFLQSAEKSHPTKMPFSRASCMFHSHRPARCSSRILQKDVGASNLEGASPSPYLIFFLTKRNLRIVIIVTFMM